MYWFPEMCKNPTGARFNIAVRKCSSKTLSRTVAKAFKLIFKQI